MQCHRGVACHRLRSLGFLNNFLWWSVFPMLTWYPLAGFVDNVLLLLYAGWALWRSIRIFWVAVSWFWIRQLLVGVALCSTVPWVFSTWFVIHVFHLFVGGFAVVGWVFVGYLPWQLRTALVVMRARQRMISQVWCMVKVWRRVVYLLIRFSVVESFVSYVFVNGASFSWPDGCHCKGRTWLVQIFLYVGNV